MRVSIILIVNFITIFTAYSQASLLSPKAYEKKMLEIKEFQLVDVRTKEEFKNGNLSPMAMNIDFYSKDFKDQTNYLDKTKPVFVYCFSGGRSADASKMLTASGFKEVYDLDGGYKAWIAKKRPMENLAVRKGMSMESYAKQINSSTPVLVVFNAQWCPPCRKLSPTIDAIQAEFSSLTIMKIDVDQDKDITKTQKVTSFPTLMLYQSGREIWRKEGYIEKADLVEALKQ